MDEILLRSDVGGISCIFFSRGVRFHDDILILDSTYGCSLCEKKIHSEDNQQMLYVPLKGLKNTKKPPMSLMNLYISIYIYYGVYRTYCTYVYVKY